MCTGLGLRKMQPVSRTQGEREERVPPASCERERARERESEGPDPAQPSIVCPTSCPTSWRNTRLIYAEYAVWGKANHVRQDTRCRLHGLEQRHPPPVKGGERVSKTTENLVNIHCDGVAVGDTATWHRLIEEYVPVELTWLSRPLLQKRREDGEEQNYFDVSLGRGYTSAEGGQVARELREARGMERLRTKAKTLLELYRHHGRHPRKLIMNLASLYGKTQWAVGGNLPWSCRGQPESRKCLLTGTKWGTYQPLRRRAHRDQTGEPPPEKPVT